MAEWYVRGFDGGDNANHQIGLAGGTKGHGAGHLLAEYRTRKEAKEALAAVPSEPRFPLLEVISRSAFIARFGVGEYQNQLSRLRRRWARCAVCGEEYPVPEPGSPEYGLPMWKGFPDYCFKCGHQAP